MARGWESKEVESQMEAAAESRRDREAAEVQRVLTNDENAREREVDSLRMSRSRVLQDIEKATHPRHKAMLDDALKTLDERIASASTVKP
jgi:hypothetical protein